MLCLLVLMPVQAQETPQRIVSMNLCTDQLLLLLVPRAHIASLSRFAADPAFSWLAEEAAGIPLNRGQAEEVLAFAPDLILTSQFSATLAANLLERLGHPVTRLGFANSTAEVLAQIRAVAALTGSGAAGDRLIGELQDAIGAGIAALLPVLQGKTALFYASNGYSYGADTLQHDFLTSVGLRNSAAEAGLRGPGQLPLETMIAAAPDYLFTDRRGALDAQLAHPLLQHPALAALGGTTRILDMPDAWFQCAGPQLGAAYRGLVEQLADAR
jgi:iron complex transport system substrate-binding protein